MPPTTLRNPNATIQQAGMLSAVQRWCISEYDRVLERHPWLPAMGVLWCSWCSAALYGTEELLSLAQLVPWLILAVTLLTLNVCEVQFQSLLKTWPGSIAWNLTFYESSEEEAFHCWSAGRGSSVWRACIRAAFVGASLLRALCRFQAELHPPLGGIGAGRILTATLPLAGWAGMHLLAAFRPLLTRRKLAALDLSAQVYLWALALALMVNSTDDRRRGGDGPPAWLAVLVMQQYDALLFLPPVFVALPSAIVGTVGTVALNFGGYYLSSSSDSEPEISFEDKSRTLFFCLLAAALYRLLSFCVCFVLEARQLHRFMCAKHSWHTDSW
eukprot:CAMPEP_0177781180 /NCGR_PEP_ID=MMETSP0491_2-20121128/17690_1 /TAXON_ID=63592 /ORGANISM="Tetraselmis chuii, Strain PLY429" /LENGTH=327 /DNA_ID=CAMNT_0019301183 /DNA_START=461 /DNA_END=1444 /DNA_ORIENTATION=+